MVIHELDRDACEAILARHTVGRLAFTLHNRVDIEPLHYVFLDGWIYGRTSPGRKILAVAHQHHVADPIRRERSHHAPLSRVPLRSLRADRSAASR